MYKNILAIFLLMYAMFGEGLLDNLDKPTPTPEPNPAVKILNIDRPSEKIIESVQVFSDKITDLNDRAKIAIFNYEFAERVLNYNADVQQINDVYSLAGKLFFKNTLVNKYDGLAEEIQKLLEKLLTDENHNISTKEKESINKYFMGISWILINQR